MHCVAAAPAELPLWGRRILVTGPRQYAGRLAAPLAAAGARVVAMPCIAIQRLEDAEQLQVRLEYASGGRRAAADEAGVCSASTATHIRM